MRGIRLFERNRSRDLRAYQTQAEEKLWRRLRGRQLAGWKFVRQHPIGPYFGDFVCRERKLIVEVDGATHSSDEEIAYDARRTTFLEEAGYRVLRINNIDVSQSLESVCDTILAALERD
ncbi:endonuclease domain-containing protein [Methylocystis heyeri]|uniref:DUF559 domain-containing protein n=1 Tax=Methylocystis heyeri TaxID=391905 RepID=A0A6B8KBD3_9HYPH|nr:endonuclease domain-containing protein [Methylocystis heyeri]QGM45704.1 DUF559 domain-containing protein [Methylocystis heyeri]